MNQMMITPEVRANMIGTLNKQSPPEIRGSWLTDRFMHLTFVSDLVPGIGIDVKEIIDKTDCEINAIIRQRINPTLERRMR